MSFTKDEFDVLMDALDEWENAPKKMTMAALPMMIVAANSAEDAKQEFDTAMADARDVSKTRSRIATLLKAKLINMQDDDAIKSAVNALRG